jgi:hypothetical protein
MATSPGGAGAAVDGGAAAPPADEVRFDAAALERACAAPAAFIREVMRVTQDQELALGALHQARREVRRRRGKATRRIARARPIR